MSTNPEQDRGREQIELSAEQREVITLLATGLADSSIARRLNLGRRTVGRRISQIYDVLGVTSRFQAGIVAAQLGIIDAEVGAGRPPQVAAISYSDAVRR